jgi:hypothetical protein
VVSGTFPNSVNYPNNSTSNYDLTEIFDEYLILIDYNEPMNPYILMNYYYKDGSCIRMVYGIKSTDLTLLDMDSENKLIPVFDSNNNLNGYGIKTSRSSNLYIFINSD